MPEPSKALAWYEAAFPAARRRTIDGSDFPCLKLGEIQLEFVPADEKLGSGPCGTVVYWSVESFSEPLAHLLAHGGKLYRGPVRAVELIVGGSYARLTGVAHNVININAYAFSFVEIELK